MLVWRRYWETSKYKHSYLFKESYLFFPVRRLFSMPTKKKISKVVLFKRIRALAILATVSVFGFNACNNSAPEAKLVVRNDSEQTINFMKIQVAGKDFEQRDILPGTERMWQFKPSREDSFLVNGQFSPNVPIQTASVGRTNQTDTREHHLTIKENGKVSYSSPK
jgi:hypothetical protein